MKIKKDLEEEIKAKEEAERRKREAVDAANLAYVKQHRDEIVADILEPVAFEQKIKNAIISRDKSIAITVRSEWDSAADWLANEVVKELTGYKTAIERVYDDDVRYSDDSRPVTVYYTMIRIWMNSSEIV